MAKLGEVASFHCPTAPDLGFVFVNLSQNFQKEFVPSCLWAFALPVPSAWNALPHHFSFKAPATPSLPGSLPRFLPSSECWLCTPSCILLLSILSSCSVYTAGIVQAPGFTVLCSAPNTQPWVGSRLGKCAGGSEWVPPALLPEYQVVVWGCIFL